MEDKQPQFIDYFAILVNWRNFLIKVFFIVCFIAAGYSLMMPKTFEANATIFPPSQDDGLGLSSLLGSLNLPFSNLLGGGFTPEAQNFLAIINSRTMMEKIAKKFSLQERYSADNLEETVRALREKLEVNVNEEGTITVTAEADTKFLPSEEDQDKARQTARDMANFIIDELDKANRTYKTEKAMNNRIFIENRYNQNLTDLKNAETALNLFQKEYGAIDLPTQARESIAAAANLKAEVIAKEIEVNSLEEFFSTNHNAYRQSRIQLNEMKKKYQEFIFGASNGTTEMVKDIFIPFQAIPDLGLQYARLYRNVLLQEKLLEFILPLYEQAKIQEAKDTPTLQVLDEAVIPIRRSKPRRTLFVLFWGMLSMILSIGYIFVVENVERLRHTSPEKYEKIANIWHALCYDLFDRKKSNED